MCRYRDLFESIKEPLLDTIEQSRGARRPTLLGLQPEVHYTLSSMDQPEFSVMLTKMTGEPPAAELGARQHCQLGPSMTEPYDLGVMPELAFDFSLPFDSGDISFDPAYTEPDMLTWCQNVESATHNGSVS